VIGFFRDGALEKSTPRIATASVGISQQGRGPPCAAGRAGKRK